ncbi:MAG: alkaline phosphatase family protein [Raineya sp.]|nr:alkaline phosphatase family protein [Raineya sp.]
MKKLSVILFLFLSISCFGQANLLQSGPMVGYSEMREVLLWVQTKSSAKVKFGYWEKGSSNKKSFTEEFTTQKSDAFTARLIADLVEPGKKYEYELYINNQKVSRSYPLEFQTQAIWAFRTEPPNFKFVAGSCFYVNDQPYDRPGTPYGSNYQIFTKMYEQKPDFMLWLGDNTYMREADWSTKTGIHYRYTHSRSLPEIQPLLGSSHHYAIWDDHDYGSNDADKSFAHKNLTFETFKLFWGNQNYGLANENQKGITGTFTWGDVQFFLLDDRYFRTANRNFASNRAILGEEQVEWLINALASSQASFKIIAVGGQFISASKEKENFINFPEERQKIIDAIQKNRIPGVVFMTGDRHFTELSKLETPKTPPIYDITVSPLTSGTHSPDKETNPLRVPNTLVVEHNFALIEVTGKRKERVMTIKIINKDGKELWKQDIKEVDLQFPKN